MSKMMAAVLVLMLAGCAGTDWEGVQRGAAMAAPPPAYMPPMMYVPPPAAPATPSAVYCRRIGNLIRCQ